MSPEAWTAVASLAAALGLLQLYFLHRQALRDQVALWRELASEWRALSESWAIAQLLVRGPENYYVDVSNEVRESFREVQRGFAATDEGFSAAHRGAAPEGWSIEHWASELHYWQGRQRAFELAARDVIRFLDGVVMLVLRGTLATRTAHFVLGRDIVRNSAVVRALVEGRTPPPTWAGNLETSANLEAPEHGAGAVAVWAEQRPGMVLRVLVLLDVLWAEAARSGDLPEADLAIAAEVKKKCRTGVRNRRRAGKAALMSSSALVAIRLRRLLRRSELRTVLNPWGVKRKFDTSAHPE